MSPHQPTAPTRRLVGRRTSSTRTQPHLRLSDAFDLFITAKEVEGLRPRTLEDHRRNHRYFERFLDEYYPGIHAEDVTVDVVRRYIRFMQSEKVMFEGHPWLAKDKSQEKRGLSPVTINVRLRCLKCFFRFLTTEGHLLEDPSTRIKLLKTQKDTLSSFSEEQVRTLLRTPDQRTFTGLRDYTLMLIMLDTGIRVSEAMGLSSENFNFEQKTITVPGDIAKNGHARLLPLSNRTATALRELIDENQQFQPVPSAIFVTNCGGYLHPSMVRSMLTKYGLKAGVTGVRVSPHTFRHTFSKTYILNGGDAFTLQRLLDHSTMEMVRRYIQMDQTDLQIQHHQFSPVNSLLGTTHRLRS